MKAGNRDEATGNSGKAKLFGFALCALLFALCHPVEAQQTGKAPRIGLLDNSTPAGSAGRLEAFRQELGKLGWIEGKNVTFEYQFAEQKPDRLPDVAAGLGPA